MVVFCPMSYKEKLVIWQRYSPLARENSMILTLFFFLFWSNIRFIYAILNCCSPFSYQSLLSQTFFFFLFQYFLYQIELLPLNTRSSFYSNYLLEFLLDRNKVDKKLVIILQKFLSNRTFIAEFERTNNVLAGLNYNNKIVKQRER